MTGKLSWRVKGLIILEAMALTLSVTAVIALTKLGLLQQEPEPLRPLIISLVVAVTLLIASALTSTLMKVLSKDKVVLGISSAPRH